MRVENPRSLDVDESILDHLVARTAGTHTTGGEVFIEADGLGGHGWDLG